MVPTLSSPRIFQFMGPFPSASVITTWLRTVWTPPRLGQERDAGISFLRRNFAPVDAMRLGPSYPRWERVVVRLSMPDTPNPQPRVPRCILQSNSGLPSVVIATLIT